MVLYFLFFFLSFFFFSFSSSFWFEISQQTEHKFYTISNKSNDLIKKYANFFLISKFSLGFCILNF